jgi:hypothetical protein
MKRKGLKVVATVLVTASAIVAIGAYAVTGPAKLSTLLSSGVVSFGAAATIGNQANGVAPRNQITAGDTALWIDSFQNAGATTGSGSLTQTWDPTRQTLQPGSLKVPTGWLPSYTTDGTTWLPSEPADRTTIKGVQATAEFTPELGKSGVVTRLTPPLISTVSTSISGGGDSFFPIFRKQNVYSVLHHDLVKMTCFSKVTGASCGQVKATKTLLTSDHADAWVNPRNGRAFTPATEAKTNAPNNVLLSCLDLDRSVDCGVIQIDTGGTVGMGSYVSTPWLYGTDLYFMYRRANTGVLMVGCANMVLLKPCLGQPFNAGVGYTVDGGWNGSNAFNVYWSSDGVNPYRTNGRVSFTTMQTATDTRTMGCFDSATRLPCVGVTPVSWTASQDPLPRLDATGALAGFCSRPGLSGALQCFDLNGVAMPASPALEAWMPSGELSWVRYLGGYGTAADTKSFMPISSGGRGDVVCFDWATDAACPGFPMTTPLSKKTYSLREDPYAPSCLWSMGDDGILESVETHSGMSGCNMSSVTVVPTYCDGLSGHVKGWDLLKLNDLAGGYTSFTLTLRDANGNVVPGWLLKKYPAGTVSIDISSIPFSGNRTTLTAEILFVGLKPASFSTTVPTVEMTWRGDPVQMCTKTTALKVCPALFVPIIPKAVAHRSDAVVTVGATKDSIGIDLAFDFLAPLSCASTSFGLTTSINGGPSPTAPGRDVRQGNTLTVTYSITNTGTTRVASPVVTDDGGTPGVTSDDITPVYVSGDTNGDGFIDQSETWVYTATGRQDAGPHQTNGTVTGTAIDGNGVPIIGVPAAFTSDTAYYFVSAPSVAIGAGIYLGADNGASCGTAKPTIYAEKDADITYCYVVVNTGNVPITSIRINDPELGETEKTMTLGSGTLASLAPGETVVLWVETINDVALTTHPVVTASPASGAAVNATATTQRFVGPPVYPPT